MKAEWVEAGVRALDIGMRNGLIQSDSYVAAVIAAVEQLIRADEREQWETHEAVQSSHIGMLLREAAHAEAVAARLVEVICEQEERADWRVSRMILRGIKMRDEALDSLRAQILSSVTALMPDENGRISKGLVQAMISGDVT